MLTGAPAAAWLDAGDDSGHPSCCRLVRWMRKSLRILLVPSAARMVVGGGFPTPSAAFDFAAGESPAGLTCAVD